MALKAQSTVEPLHCSLKTEPVWIDIHCWHNGQQSQIHWNLFDRLVRFEDSKLSVDYAYDPLGRRIQKYSNAHY